MSSFLLGKYLGMECWFRKGRNMFSFIRNQTLVFQNRWIIISSPTMSEGGSIRLPTFGLSVTNTTHKDFSPFCRCAIVLHCAFNVSFPNNCADHLSCILLHAYLPLTNTACLFVQGAVTLQALATSSLGLIWQGP